MHALEIGDRRGNFHGKHVLALFELAENVKTPRAVHIVGLAEKTTVQIDLAERIESIATEKAKATLSSYSAMNIIETRSNISPQVEEVIKNAVDEEYCVDIVAVVLTNIDFSDAFER